MSSSGLTRRGRASGFGSFIWTRNQRAYDCIVATDFDFSPEVTRGADLT